MTKLYLWARLILLFQLCASWQRMMKWLVSLCNRTESWARTRVKSPPMKMPADELGLNVIQPEKLRAPEAMNQLRLWNPDLIVVAAFGQILKPDVLALPPHGCINVHASLLPRWRGAAPIRPRFWLVIFKPA